MSVFTMYEQISICKSSRKHNTIALSRVLAFYDIYDVNTVMYFLENCNILWLVMPIFICIFDDACFIILIILS
ncbi:hypothetical protein NY2A_b474L [Paramecium bursaria Chlorella virus NY2A]|uniref:Uncharacterized protein b474L n=1 Tax=Paramecium bursaria Chlorella virus NY2A TaxID=46021 RepID=A7IWZ9_PBCVN|nr:hypothetical protein NY2A_b474L [Paramecium bursaria Chlorella virus NY2A]YP_001498501.1 hypothetical protein AR158_c420L [Paramecium bursaria Chlorella virus AR158]ABT14873.1 hypothetical protein NY2A_b474L [Paramecium bursaria Chlorella virus NY2A]ABU43965.1 hypothetical protein AR158_c420L [Paramecium bursaria Chlorella virus AR158]